MLALGLNIVVGYAGLLDLGYVAFYVIGAYTMAAGSFGFIQQANGTTTKIPVFPFWALLPVGAILAGFFGALLGAPTLRLRGDYLAIVTLGFGEIVPIVFNNLPYFYGPVGISSNPPDDIGPFVFSDPTNPAPFYYLALVIVVLLILAVLSLRESSLGRAWVAIREDETAAAASGVNLVRTKLLAFALGATIGGIGGVMNAAFTTSITPKDFSFNISITIVIMVVLGGLGSVPGVILGAILLRFFDVYLLGQINEYIHGTLHLFTSIDFNTSKYLIYGLILVAMILLRPQGLIPNRRRARELHGEGVASESLSAIGTVEREEFGETIGGSGSEDDTAYTGAGSDAQGRED
jgi:branched-chain amino acid transport system permease protein